MASRGRIEEDVQDGRCLDFAAGSSSPTLCFRACIGWFDSVDNDVEPQRVDRALIIRLDRPQHGDGGKPYVRIDVGGQQFDRVS
ncbi:hypothetical protein [Streptomyces sp. NPDC057403]|uniref:hypothetical protein n=1 Tax=Streptomyces sp. NPDC057403 TaxID=3346119 RepID=UPI0036C44078